MTLTQDLMRMWWMQQQGGEPPTPPTPVDPYTEKAAIAAVSSGHVDKQSYIDTGLTHSINDIWEVTAKNTETQSRSPIGTGQAKDDGTNFAIWLHGEKSPKYAEFVFGYGSNAAYRLNVNVDVAVAHIYKMELSTGKAWIDGEYVGQASSVGALGTSKKLVIYGCWRGNGPTADFYSGYLGPVKIYRSGDLLRDFVPCIKTDGEVACVYDKCESRGVDVSFYYMNRGTGIVYDSI